MSSVMVILGTSVIGSYMISFGWNSRFGLICSVGQFIGEWFNPFSPQFSQKLQHPPYQVDVRWACDVVVCLSGTHRWIQHSGNHRAGNHEQADKESEERNCTIVALFGAESGIAPFEATALENAAREKRSIRFCAYYVICLLHSFGRQIIFCSNVTGRTSGRAAATVYAKWKGSGW